MPYPARSRPQRNLTLVAALAFAWLLGAVPAHAEDKYQAHVKRGSELVRTEEYATALGQFEAAYALRQSTALLYQIARCHHRLGNTTEARGFYRRYLNAAPNIDARQRREIQDSLRQLGEEVTSSTTTTGSPPGLGSRLVASTNPNVWSTGQGNHRLANDSTEQKRAEALAGWPKEPRIPNSALNSNDDDDSDDQRPAPSPRRTRVRSPGMVVGGSILWVAAYIPAVVLGSMVLVGTSLTPSSASRDLVGAVGGTLLVPIAGPFVSGVLSASYQWAAPWILIDGAAQIAGLAMLVSGARSVPDNGYQSSAIDWSSVHPSSLVNSTPALSISF